MQHGHLARLQQTLVNTHLLATSRLCVYVCVCVCVYVCVNPHVTTTELQEDTFFSVL